MGNIIREAILFEKQYYFLILYHIVTLFDRKILKWNILNNLSKQELNIKISN